MVHDSDPHIIGITESWANKDISDVELRLEGYVMFRKDRMGRRRGGVLLYVKESVPDLGLWRPLGNDVIEKVVMIVRTCTALCFHSKCQGM